MLLIVPYVQYVQYTQDLVEGMGCRFFGTELSGYAPSRLQSGVSAIRLTS